MNFNLDSFSIVILAQAHNPSILNPDFLKNQGIISNLLTPDKIICTPPVAQVSYVEGISITAEFDKLQFTDVSPKRIPLESPVPEISEKYIKTLPHVKYTAIGLNFIGHYTKKDNKLISSFLYNKFLKKDSWSSYGDSLPYVGLKFTYTLKNIKCTINMDTILTNEQSQPIIAITANYHLDSTTIEEITSFIMDWKTQYNHFLKIILDNFSEE